MQFNVPYANERSFGICSFGVALLDKSQKWLLLAFIFGGTSLLGNVNFTGHKKEELDTKLGGHCIVKAAYDYSWEQILMVPHDCPAE